VDRDSAHRAAGIGDIQPAVLSEVRVRQYGVQSPLPVGVAGGKGGDIEHPPLIARGVVDRHHVTGLVSREKPPAGGHDLHIRTSRAYVGHLIEGEAAGDLRIPGRRGASQVPGVPLGRLFG